MIDMATRLIGGWVWYLQKLHARSIAVMPVTVTAFNLRELSCPVFV